MNYLSHGFNTTIYTGKEYKDHKLFRLGDILNRNDLKQIFEELEDSGFSGGCFAF